MRILHLSDLHVTHDGRTLDELWLVAERAIKDQTFDFVVVSGDLTQRAQPEEYARLIKFLEKRIEPRVRRPDHTPVKPRVIIVPGNHDVDWQAKVFEPIPLAHHAPQDVEAWFKAATWSPESKAYRVQYGANGHTSLYRIDDARYAERFANVERFFEEYYAGTLEEPHRRFRLLDPTGDGDWSAHVFPAERVAFLGFNSCHRNDRYWHGAYIHHAAIQAAKDHLDRQPGAESLVRVAVWHHGLESHRARPDRLTLENLGVLLSAGTRVGFHGHVHESVAEVHRFISDDFALVSTGTLGAASDDRPDAIGNQFSVVDLHWNRLRIDVFERASRLGEYDKRSSRYMYFDRTPNTDLSQPMRSWAGRVTRRVTLDEKDGIASVEIHMEDLYLIDPIVLARFDARLTAIGDPQARVDGELIDVTDVQTAQRREFRFAVPARKGRYKSLSWRYRLANALAVNRAELELLPRRKPDHPHIDESSQEAWSHVVQFDYDRLELSLRFLPANGESTTDYLLGTDSFDVSEIVERRLGGESGSWERVPAEESRAQKQTSGTGFDLAWTSPMAGYRYGALYRINPPGHLVPRSERGQLETVLQKCRSTRVGADLRKVLTSRMTHFVRAALGVDEEAPHSFDEHLMGIGYLWSDRERLLKACFGHFPPDAWATAFAAGRGVAGHAFRFSRPAAWHRAAPGDLDVIKAPTQPGSRDYEWILCLPLLLEPTGTSVGVVSFAATSNDTQAATELSELAQNVGTPSPRLKALWMFVNVGFWDALERCGRKAPVLPRGVMALAERAKRAFLPDSPALDEDA